MSFQTILHEIDAQMDTLQQARNLIVTSQGIAGAPVILAPTRANGAPGRTIQASTIMPVGVNRISSRPGMSEEARKRIGDATRKRWAAKKKAAK